MDVVKNLEMNKNEFSAGLSNLKKIEFHDKQCRDSTNISKMFLLIHTPANNLSNVLICRL